MLKIKTNGKLDGTLLMTDRLSQKRYWFSAKTRDVRMQWLQVQVRALHAPIEANVQIAKAKVNMSGYETACFKARMGIEPMIFGLRDQRLTTWPPSPPDGPPSL